VEGARFLTTDLQKSQGINFATIFWSAVLCHFSGNLKIRLFHLGTARWLTSVILATQEVEIRSILV
jgi:hypothetical protein